MTPQERALISELRDLLLEDLYCEPKYSAWAHTLAGAIRRADVALGTLHYDDLRRRYPGPQRAAKRRAA